MTRVLPLVGEVHSANNDEARWGTLTSKAQGMPTILHGLQGQSLACRSSPTQPQALEGTARI